MIEREFLGVRCHLFTIQLLNELVWDKILAKEKTIIANHNLHSVYLFHKNQEFRNFFKIAQYVHIDGMPLVYLGKMAGHEVTKKNRITYLDWIHPLMQLANAESCRIFYLGGKPGVARSAISFLNQKYPNIKFNERNGFFNMANFEENKSVLQDIKMFSPDILMVGMSMPRQEIWISNNINELPNCVILPCGACFDYLAGEVKAPPRFLGSVGLEWLYRFFQEPKRLFPRYFIEPLFLLPLLFTDLKNKYLKNLNKG